LGAGNRGEPCQYAGSEYDAQFPVHDADDAPVSVSREEPFRPHASGQSLRFRDGVEPGAGYAKRRILRADLNAASLDASAMCASICRRGTSPGRVAGGNGACGDNCARVASRSSTPRVCKEVNGAGALDGGIDFTRQRQLARSRTRLVRNACSENGSAARY
jgi:hypothetical protein